MISLELIGIVGVIMQLSSSELHDIKQYEISPLDELFAGNNGEELSAEFISHHLDQYLRCGIEMAQYATSVCPSPTSILELPCGFGRVTRHLLTSFPVAQLQCVDVLPEAISFQKNKLHTDAILIDPPSLQYDAVADDHFDLVIVGALMTHFSETNSTIFLEEMRRKTRPGGRIITTVRGEAAFQKFREQPIYQTTEEDRQRMLTDYQSYGYGFASYAEAHSFEAETARVAGSDYGIALTSPMWLIKLAVSTGLRLVDYRLGGWDNHLDFFTFERV